MKHLFRILALAVFCAATAHPATAQDSAEIFARLDQLQNQIRQLTGQVEQLQYRNQQLEAQVRSMQEQGAARPQAMARGNTLPPPASAPPISTGRGDAFDPSQSPGAPGAPRALGQPGRRVDVGEASDYPGRPAGTLPGGAPQIATNEDVGVPGGRPAGAPLDLSTMSNAAVNDPSLAPPSPAARNPSAVGATATLPPTPSPRDEYDLGYGYLQRKDYAQAEQTLRAFLQKYPKDRLAAEAQFWLGESMFQRQDYRDAAATFLDMSKKYESHPKAPNALLRLGESLAALNEHELACATLSEVARKYPKASNGVKQAADREQKRAGC
ncbi:MAG: tol-pal system protein YbgF [Xanthobacteraceae bacterium]|nr:tol-pal system protein YbgF [Xanthobacteraceae bacterium]MBV9632978.1 tol-pal system protein YbgF [Xanthobacteraceae bacterium]